MVRTITILNTNLLAFLCEVEHVKFALEEEARQLSSSTVTFNDRKSFIYWSLGILAKKAEYISWDKYKNKTVDVVKELCNDIITTDVEGLADLMVVCAKLNQVMSLVDTYLGEVYSTKNRE